MKDSGNKLDPKNKFLGGKNCDWIGEIPDDWKISKIKYCFKNGKGLPITKENLISEGLPVISYGQIHSKTNTGVNIKQDLIRFVSYDYQKKYPQCEVFKYDFIFADTSEDYEGCGNCVYKREDGILFAGYHSIILHSLQKQDNRYLAYLFKTDIWRKQLREVAIGVKVFSITQKILLNSKILIPPLDEQQQIADFLDNKCSKIDKLLELLTKQIKVLSEYKKSLITETVTKGLNHDVEMKDSGYDFIGEIPVKWEICKIRHIGNPQNGISFGSNSYGDGYPFVSYSDVYRNFSLPKQVKGLIQSSETDRERYSVRKGDIFFTRTSETKEEIGFSCVCEETIPDAVFAGFLIRVRPFNNKLYTGFAKYYFRSNHLRAYFVKEMNLVIRASLGQELLKGTPITLPPLDEQQQIADFLDNKCSKIDKLLENKKKQIETLKKYKKSLIYEYVTGKKEVK